MRIFVSGMGIMSGLGCSVEETLQALLQERAALAPPRYIATVHKNLPVGEVPMSDEEMRLKLNMSKDEVITRTSLLGIMAVRECLQMSEGKTEGRRQKAESGWGGRMGLISGNTVGGMEKSELFYKEFLNPLQNEHTPYIDAHDCGACTEKIADYFGDFEFITSISTACSSAANAVAMGARMIRSGRLDRVVAGGTECLSKFHINGFLSLMILSEFPSTPFDINRKGINLGEGAAYLLLESEEALQRRGGFALAELTGYGNACDAYHQTASSPEGEGAFIAMKEALEMSGLKYHDISYINAHGTGTVNNDASEGKAIERLFGHTPPPVSSTKPFTGHTTSAAGTVEAVISILSMLNGFIPANLNYKEPDPAISFVPVIKTVTGQTLNHVMTNSFGFGGNNSSLIFSKVSAS